MQLRVDVNEGAAFAPMNLEQLAAHYQRVELPQKPIPQQRVQELSRSPHCAEVGEASLSAIKSVEVENWLRNFKKVNGQPASPGTKTKIRT